MRQASMKHDEAHPAATQVPERMLSPVIVPGEVHMPCMHSAFPSWVRAVPVPANVIVRFAASAHSAPSASMRVAPGAPCVPTLLRRPPALTMQPRVVAGAASTAGEPQGQPARSNPPVLSLSLRGPRRCSNASAESEPSFLLRPCATPTSCRVHKATHSARCAATALRCKRPWKSARLSSGSLLLASGSIVSITLCCPLNRCALNRT